MTVLVKGGRFMLKLEYFYYMVEIAKAGTINRAAENLYLSQPYLSLSLKDMENVLGVTLFSRTNKGVILTEAGKEFLEYSNQVIALVNKSNSLRKHYSSARERLSVTSMPSFTMMDLYHNFSASEPFKNCDISYDELPNSLIFEKVIQGIHDIGICYIISEEYGIVLKEITSQGLNFVPLVNEPLCAVVSTDNPIFQKKRVLLKELDCFEFLVESIELPGKPSPVENNPFPHTFKKGRFRTKSFNNNRSLQYYLTKSSHSFCIGQRALNLTNPFVQSGTLNYIPISDMKVSLITGYITCEAFISSPLEEAFIDYLEQFFQEYNESNPDLVLPV